MKNFGFKSVYDHLYDTPEIYDLLYHRTLAYKVGEARAYAHILEKEKPKIGTMMELFAGDTSKHRQPFLDAFSFPVKGYLSMDRVSTDGVALDIIRSPLPKKFDVGVAYFYSASSIVDMAADGRITRSGTQAAFTNIYRGLNPGGLFVLNTVTDGYAGGTALDQNVTGKNHEEEFWVDYSSDLGKHLRGAGLSFNPKDDLTLHVRNKQWYERISGNNVDNVSQVWLTKNGKSSGLAIKYRLPFCQRYFSEPELVDMLHAAGFAKVGFWHCDFLEEDNVELSPNLTFEPDVNELDPEDDVRESYLPNVLIGYK